MRSGRIVAAAFTIVMASGCSSSGSAPTHRLIGFNFVANDVTGWTELVTLDPQALRAHGRILRLNDAITADEDAAATSPVGQLSPDGKTLAVGGSSGRILLLDPARLRRLGSITLERGSDEVVDVDAWPRADRLLVVYGHFSVRNPRGDSIAVVDPRAKRVLSHARLHGFVEHADKQRNGSLALLVGGLGRPLRMVAVSPDGRVRSFSLPSLGPLPGVHVGGRFFVGRRWPSVATDGRGRAFVVADRAPILEVDLRTGDTSAHALSLTRRSLGLPQPPGWVPGTRAPELTYGRSVTWLGHGLLGIGGGVSRAVRVGDQLGEQYRPYAYQVVDIRSWRTVRTMRLTGCEARFGLYLCSESVGGFPPDSKGSRGSTLLVYDRHWRLLYRKRSTTLWREAVAGRLLAGAADGSSISVLDPRTGRVVRRLGPMRVWPPDILDWRGS
jgi:hypothetical protein